MDGSILGGSGLAGGTLAGREASPGLPVTGDCGIFTRWG
jgi:hypothetical protein